MTFAHILRDRSSIPFRHETFLSVITIHSYIIITTIVSAYPPAVAEPVDTPKLRTTANWTFLLTCKTTDKTQQNATITLVPVTAKGKHTGDNSTSVPDTKQLFTNTLTSSE